MDRLSRTSLMILVLTNTLWREELHTIVLGSEHYLDVVLASLLSMTNGKSKSGIPNGADALPYPYQ